MQEYMFLILPMKLSSTTNYNHQRCFKFNSKALWWETHVLTHVSVMMRLLKEIPYFSMSFCTTMDTMQRKTMKI